jgi:aspartate beta-hydroxylase
MKTQHLWSRDIPAAVRLNLPLDARSLLEDLNRASDYMWRPEEPFRFDGFFGSETKVYHNGDWQGLSLRSQGGSLKRTDPGGPGLEDFEDTPLMSRTPYIAAMLRDWNVPVRSVRLLKLPAGASIMEHRDTYHGFEYGQLRLHVPITTNPDVVMCIRGQKWHWPAGEAWYGDFGSLHEVHNNGPSDRVHLVVDVLVTPAVLALFPEHFARLAERTDILYHEPASEALDAKLLRALECEFRVPSTLVRGIFDVDDGIIGQLESRIYVKDGALRWMVDGRDIVRLSPLSRNRLAFTGWAMERYFEYSCENGRISRLELVLRCGREGTRIQFDLHSAETLLQEVALS